MAATPGKRLDINMYTQAHKIHRKVPKLPANLLDAVRRFDDSEVARSAFGDEVVTSYVKLKKEEWRRFSANHHIMGARTYAGLLIAPAS